MMFLNKTYAIAVILSLVLSPALAASTGIDTASGSTTLPFSIESNTVMNLKSDGLHFESGKSINVDTANIGTVAYVDGSKVIKTADIPNCVSPQFLQFDSATSTFSCGSITGTLQMLNGNGCSSCPYGTTDSSSTVPYTHSCGKNGAGSCTHGTITTTYTYCKRKLQNGTTSGSDAQCYYSKVYSSNLQSDTYTNMDWVLTTY